MGQKKSPKASEPELPLEMSALFEGMQDLLVDEYGNPLPPDHPQYKKFTALVEHMTEVLEHRDPDDPSSGQHGHA